MSGNTFHFKPADEDLMDLGVVLQDNIVIGAFAGKEAIRKNLAFSNLPNTVVHPDVQFPTSMDFEPIFQSIQRYGEMFYPFKDVIVRDRMSHDGSTNACTSRYEYWRSVGLDVMVDNRQIGIPMWAIILNHLSIFGRNNFQRSFVADKNEPQIGVWISTQTSIFRNKHKYQKEYLSPAIYLLRLGRHVTSLKE